MQGFFTTILAKLNNGCPSLKFTEDMSFFIEETTQRNNGNNTRFVPLFQHIIYLHILLLFFQFRFNIHYASVINYCSCNSTHYRTVTFRDFILVFMQICLRQK